MRRRWLIGILILILPFLAVAPVHADPADDIPPHLGYGIHFGPNTRTSPSLVNQLGFDWVKIYDLGQVGLFPGKRILYRWDMTWPTNWDSFRVSVAQTARVIAQADIDAVEIHNEPNLSNEWNGNTPNGWQYTQVLRIAYTTIKRIKPSLIVVSGGLAPTITTGNRGAINDLEFAKEMFENGADQWFDAFGYHPYGYNAPPEADPGGAQPLVFRRTEQIRALMEQYGIHKQIWLTEFGWLRDPAEDGVGCSDNDPAFAGFAWMRVSGATQADYLVRAFQYAHQNWPWAGPMFVWNLNFNQMTFLQACNQMRWFGLVRGNGDLTPAFYKLAAMKRYPSDYQPKLQLTVTSPQFFAEISLRCPRRTLIGTFKVENTGYPANVDLNVEPVNTGQPPYVETEPARARIGDSINVYVDPQGMDSPQRYPVFVNARATYAGRPISQSVQGSIITTFDTAPCG